MYFLGWVSPFSRLFSVYQVIFLPSLLLLKAERWESPAGAPGGMLELRFRAAQELGVAAPCSPSPPTTRRQPWWAHLTQPRHQHRHQHRHIRQQSSEPGPPPANHPYPTALPAPWLRNAPGIDACDWGRGTQVSALWSLPPPAPRALSAPTRRARLHGARCTSGLRAPGFMGRDDLVP